MNQTFTIKEKIKQFSTILYPILITQLALFAMSFFDTMMSGRAGSDDLAGVAIGVSLWIPVFTGLSGILLAVTPIVAQLIGAKKSERVPFTVLQAIYLSIIMAIAILLAGIFIVNPILNVMGLETDVQHIARHYLIGLAFGIVPLFAYTVLRCFVDALGHTRVTMFVTLVSLPINILFNYLLIYGKFGFPQLGGIGAGYATSITYWLIFIIAIFIVIRNEPFSTFSVFNRLYPFDYSVWKDVLKVGIPIGFAIFFEVSIFSAVTLFMSSFNTITIASHQAAINFASFLYMIPLSISMALTIVVGFEVGASRFKDAKVYSYLGIFVAIALSVVSAAIIFIFREGVASLYTKDPDVLQLTQHFLIYAIFFQLSDAIATPTQGALRGYKDVNVTFFMALVSYWVIGLPLGYILANYTSWGQFGYWIGLIAGLAAGAIGLLTRLVKVQKITRKQILIIQKMKNGHLPVFLLPI